MTLAALVVVVVALMVLALGVVIGSLGRQVRHLQTEVQALTLSRNVAQPARVEDLVLTPTPLGPAEVEPDLSVSRVVSVTLAAPLIKVVAFSHGVRRALGEDSRMRVGYAFRKELKRQRKVRRKRATAARPPRHEGRRP